MSIGGRKVAASSKPSPGKFCSICRKPKPTEEFVVVGIDFICRECAKDIWGSQPDADPADNTETIQDLAAKAGDETLRALMDVINERFRQIAVEGWTPEHDDANGAAELAAASGSYALHAYDDDKPKGFVPAWWPYADEWYKPTTQERDLIKSIALGLAALEAEYRAQAKGGAA